MVHDVFMSYSRKDEDTMKRIVEFLRSQDIKVWVDNEKLVPGTPIWEVEIEKAIKNAKAIVVLMSPDSKNSEWVRREIGYSQRCETRTFPLLIRGDEDSSVTIRLINTQYIDLRQREKVGLRSLSVALKEYLKEFGGKEKLASEKGKKSTRVSVSDNEKRHLEQDKDAEPSRQHKSPNSAGEVVIDKGLDLTDTSFRQLVVVLIILTAIISACSLILSITRLF